MNKLFSITLRELREEKNISQNKLAELLEVDRSAVAHWESGDRIPSTKLLMKLARVLEVDISVLMNDQSDNKSDFLVMIVDDEAIALQGAKNIVADALPDAQVVAFKRSSEALEFARNNTISLALLDIEIGKVSGLDLSQMIHEITPSTTIIFLTAYPDYALDAWSTYAGGFLVKPLKKNELLKQLDMLRINPGNH